MGNKTTKVAPKTVDPQDKVVRLPALPPYPEIPGLEQLTKVYSAKPSSVGEGPDCPEYWTHSVGNLTINLEHTGREADKCNIEDLFQVKVLAAKQLNMEFDEYFVEKYRGGCADQMGGSFMGVSEKKLKECVSLLLKDNKLLENQISKTHDDDGDHIVFGGTMKVLADEILTCVPFYQSAYQEDKFGFLGKVRPRGQPQTSPWIMLRFTVDLKLGDGYRFQEKLSPGQASGVVCGDIKLTAENPDNEKKWLRKPGFPIGAASLRCKVTVRDEHLNTEDSDDMTPGMSCSYL